MTQLKTKLAALRQRFNGILSHRQRKPEPPICRNSITALVCLLNQPRQMDPAAIICAIEAAYGRKFNVPGTGYVAQQVPPPPQTHLKVKVVAAKTPRHMIAISYGDERYFSAPPDRESAARTALGRAMAYHKGWITVDRMGDAPPAAQMYPVLGKVMAELIGPDCLAIFCPGTNQVKLVNADTVAILRSDRPMDALGPGEKGPIIGARAGDEELATAVAVARQRWPEFVTAFAHRRDNEEFFVKVPLATGNGSLEHIWMSVERLESEWITGILKNVPQDIPGHRYGDRLKISSQKMEDWFYSRGGQTFGGFSAEVLMARKQRESARGG